MDEKQFRQMFEDRAIVVADVPAGTARDLAAKANRPAGLGDATLRTRAEFDALYDAIQGPEAERLAEAYEKASLGKEDFFARRMYQVAITDWPPAEMRPEEPVESSGDARVGLWRADPGDQRVVPPPDEAGLLFTSSTFSLVNSGNKTKFAPKRSWKVDVDPGDDDDRIVGMSRLNLKSMYNDPSQMREAIAWALLRRIGIPSARHTYARVAINGGYQGLYSLIEQVDRSFLRERFGANNRGNLYKAYCGDVGCATLERRVGPDGDDSGRQYFTRHDNPDLTYRLKTNEDDPALNGYDDLADLVRVINSGSYGSDNFRSSVEDLFDVRGFLRWAALNVLLGSWDNYYATPANYYLYNGGKVGAPKDFLDKPYFTFIPWDYDNCLGIDYFGTSWQYTDLLDWPASTMAYHQGKGESRIPLVQNLLANHDFAQYYLDHVEHLLDTDFTPAALSARMAELWQRVIPSAYFEADFPNSAPFTGRQFTNDEVWRAGHEQQELRHANEFVLGVYHYARMRCDRARSQLAALRAEYPAGASGALFPGGGVSPGGARGAVSPGAAGSAGSGGGAGSGRGASAAGGASAVGGAGAAGGASAVGGAGAAGGATAMGGTGAAGAVGGAGGAASPVGPRGD
ncbi:CotH kinase family protein [Paractinoplanes globisporus]|uniref:CotH kinase family protein n=1 Tax=Paractinoplanes globisporus TaxID=113565 RepID=A0ABW6WCD8_9ACTN|nr:CotH kinase family protein [Actinoplanes globisporus]